jgi:hypothetical protein
MVNIILQVDWKMYVNEELARIFTRSYTGAEWQCDRDKNSPSHDLLGD